MTEQNQALRKAIGRVLRTSQEASLEYMKRPDSPGSHFNRSVTGPVSAAHNNLDAVLRSQRYKNF